MAKAHAQPAAAQTRKEQLIQALIILGVAVAAMWGLELIDWATGHALDRSLGIRPRDPAGLIGLVGAPFMHGDVAHLTANTIPFVVLGLFVMLRGVPTFFKTTAFIALVGGLLVWIAARDANHIGASGVIFGYFGYLLGVGFFERSFKSILVAGLVAFLYGGIIFGVLPNDPRISWEGHLFGFIAGGGWAYLSVGRERLADKRAKGQTPTRV
ncbi:MAG: rhomboid family intramembrane serine protease [Deltaproteobacteria bacterium HGW-Deltaproteobacteria-14]|jgi:membrane associated rhomboid family serine protease|nr:MAG: rhomboid family intramembrane serine protease [Deltaproteobacteria bacterium HGW-Deltaproteobacteria-14]